MQTDFERMFQRADNHYLQPPEILVFRHHVGVLAERLATYKYLRDNELLIFQAIADQLEATFSEESPKILERSLKHWISTLRYGAMAMLLNNPEYFQHRILEWLGGSLKAYDRAQIDRQVYHLLREQLTAQLTAEQFRLLEPFLEQAQSHLLPHATEANADHDMMIGELA